MEWRRGEYLISDDPARVDIDATWEFLRRSYWSPNVPREIVADAVAGSLVAGLYAADGAQAGFARAVTDRATFAWIADVFVLPEHRGQGLGVWLVETLIGHPDLARVRQYVLATADAHELYARLGFEPIDGSRYMRRARPLAELYGDGRVS